MEPIGLRFKHDGELMIVHRCLICGKESNNRIAGDDIPDVVMHLLIEHPIKNNLLAKDRFYEVYEALFGRK